METLLSQPLLPSLHICSQSCSQEGSLGSHPALSLSELQLLHQRCTSSSCLCSAELWLPVLVVLNLPSPLFTCRSMYPSSVLESLEYLTLLLGIPAERLVRDDIIPGGPGHQLQPGQQGESKNRRENWVMGV